MKKSKSWDMQLHWLRDRQNRDHFDVRWEKGSVNASDYFTKHFNSTYHRQIRSKYVIDAVHSLRERVMNAL